LDPVAVPAEVLSVIVARRAVERAALVPQQHMVMAPRSEIRPPSIWRLLVGGPPFP
jgi:hypothetical protein